MFSDIQTKLKSIIIFHIKSYGMKKLFPIKKYNLFLFKRIDLKVTMPFLRKSFLNVTIKVA